MLTKTIGLITLLGFFVIPLYPQQVDREARDRAQVMLKEAASDVRKYYYDPKLHGLDWDSKVENAKAEIEKATSEEAMILQVAAVLESLQDSHTFFVPPRDPIAQDYGWRYEMVGSRCYVTHVRPKSDAESKGVKPGDQVLSIDNFELTRDGLKKMEYVLDALLPQSSLHLELVDQSGKIRKVDVLAKVRQPKAVMDFGDLTGRDSWRIRLEREDQQHLIRPQYKELGRELMILKLPSFLPTSVDVRHLVDKAREHACLILDLRGNPGGAEPILQGLLGGVFENDVKIADRVMRESTEPVMAKGSHHKAFTGKLIVLVDSRSGSAAELFAHVIQIEKRGLVFGDRTSGSVMEAKHYEHRTGSNPFFLYGTSISSADLIMSDGKSLEHTGVKPDQSMLPTAEDFAIGRDPVMAHAAELAGVSLTPEAAGKLFTFEWPME
jgi:carboxyl-terminal processing protease